MFIIIGQSSSNQDLVSKADLVDDVCLLFYILEALIKIIGLGVDKYFEDGWNKFDFFMIMISLTT